MHAFLSGFSLTISLILSIGAQNAFVLKQGIKKEHIFIICFICGLSDAVLIFLGVSGFGFLVEKFPSIETLARYGGFTFLFAYALKSFYSAYSMSHQLNPEGTAPKSLFKTVLLTIAFTWLNPHVYLDTVLLLGSFSTKFGDMAPLFGFGAMTGSFIFFFTLGYGARILAPLFKKPKSWKILEFIIGCIMLFLAIMLIV